MVGSKGVINKQEFIKIITSALYSLGYDRTGALLEEESGIWLHSSAVNLFMQQVLDGKWDESLATLHDIDLSDETVVKSASFLILEQKFLELLKEGKVMAALGTLRNEIMPLSINVGRVHDLAACIISPPHCVVLELSSQNNATNSRSRFLEKLQILFPAAVMVPERRSSVWKKPDSFSNIIVCTGMDSGAEPASMVPYPKRGRGDDVNLQPLLGS
ncbi:hypothetical protein F0562_036202 [Nyssa sinensis]|uniref:CTLH domain-containing protein n=1 Tax=Nyssa sinensis TaxID=561372 RepID=A0A5J5AHA8_9ASTE|nr:hypothetical protein F0562_036202 [Nyssa sinensis]